MFLPCEQTTLKHVLRGTLLAACFAFASPALAVTVTGVVRDNLNAPVGNVDIDFIDSCTGDNVFLAADRTAADGSFSISIAAGTYDIHFVPPTGSTLCAGDLQTYVITGNMSLGTISLVQGRLVSGTVLTPGLAAAANVDLKFVDLGTGSRRFLSKTLTNVSGQYAIRVPPGSYDIDFRPAAGSAFADGERLGLVVGATDVSGLSNTLKTGFTVSGSIRGQSNARLKNVDIDVFDLCTGRRIATSHDNSDVNGNFSVVVPSGTYSFTFNPPRCLGVYAERLPSVVVSAAASLGTITLKAAVPVVGSVLDDLGVPLANAKLKFYDVTQVASPRVGATDDRTDASGNFNILVPEGTYDVNIEPPAGRNLLVYHINNLIVGPAGGFPGILQMSPGTLLTGRVLGPGGVPQENVNINVLDHVTRTSQRIAHDNTDANGDFTVVVNPGTYDIHYDPPVCSPMAPMSQDSVEIVTNTVLPTMNVVNGIHLTGLVTDPAALPVAGTDLDVYPAGGATKLYTPLDNTSAAGVYDVLVPPGVYDVRFVPGAPTRLRPALRAAVDLTAPAAQPTLVLQNGFVLSGTVHYSNLLPANNADLVLYTASYLPPLWAPHSTVNTLGAFTFSVPAGTYDIHYIPVLGSPYQETWRYGVVVNGDLNLGDQVLALPSTGVGPGVLSGLALSAPSPNPSRSGVHMTFTVPEGEAELTAWDVAGRQVGTLWHGHSAGSVTVQWDGRAANGASLPAGLYLVRLRDGAGRSQFQRVTLLQ